MKLQLNHAAPVKRLSLKALSSGGADVGTVEVRSP